jgi:plasmid stabilization system protein ParE
MLYRIYRRPRQQLQDIWLYTASKWGVLQADRYIRGLYDKLKEISEFPGRWRKVERPTVRNVFFFRYEKHIVFFRLLSQGQVGVISVLHERMNWPRRLLEDMREEP